MDGVRDYYMVEENLWGAERDAICFALSHSVLRISLAVVLLLVLAGCVLEFGFLVVFFVRFQGNFCIQLAFNSRRISSSWPTMPRTCPAMQKKKNVIFFLPLPLLGMPPEGILGKPGCPCLLERSSDLEELSNNCSATIGAQLAGNHTYRVFIKPHDPNHWVNPPLSLGCGVPSWYFLFPLCSLFSLQIILTKPVLPRALSDAAFGVQWQYPRPRCQQRLNRIFDSWWHAFSKERVAHLHYQGGFHRDHYGTNFSQRTAQIAGQAPVDGHQD